MFPVRFKSMQFELIISGIIILGETLKLMHIL